jgi:hypothetical protein
VVTLESADTVTVKELASGSEQNLTDFRDPVIKMSMAYGRQTPFHVQCRRFFPVWLLLLFLLPIEISSSAAIQSLARWMDRSLDG